MTIIYRVHALQRMFQRGIRADDVREVLELGEVVEDYPNDFPYPSRLMLGHPRSRPIHVVAGSNAAGDETIVITAYEPDPALWEPDFKRRRP